VDRVRTLLNIVPYRYRVDAEGRIVSCRFDDLNDVEVERLDLLVVQTDLTSEEAHDLRELRERQWVGTLPTAKAAEALVHQLSPFRIGVHSPAIKFFEAFSLASSNSMLPDSPAIGNLQRKRNFQVRSID
jgi:hypothetical protein